jgi:hypothetical protein
MSDPVLDAISKIMAVSAAATSMPFTLWRTAASVEKVDTLDDFFKALD